LSDHPANRPADSRSGTDAPAATGFRGDLHWLMGIFVLAAVMRFGAAWQTQVISKDGFAWYIAPAREAVEEGRWLSLVRDEDGYPRDHHPLYPAVLALAGAVVPEWDLAGQALGVVLGALLIFPCYSFTKTIFGRRTGLFAAAVVALMPRYCEYSADVLSEPLSNLMMMSSLSFGAKWARDYRWRHSALCGFLGGLAYLTRPEGLCFALAPLGWGLLLLLLGLSGKLQRRPGLEKAARRSLTALPSLAVCFAIGFPYVLYLRHDVARQGGGWHWVLTRTHHPAVILELKQEAPLGIAAELKPNARSGDGAPSTALEMPLAGTMNLAVAEEEIPHEDRREFHWRLWMLLRRFGEANYPFIFAMFLGLLMIFWRPFHLLPAWYVSAHFWGFFVIYLMFNYVSPYAMARRHFVVLGCIAMPWIALGTQTLWDVARRRQRNVFMSLVRVLSMALLVVALGLSLHFAWKRHRIEKVGLRRAGEWISSAYGGPGARVLTLTDPRPAFYAQAEPLRVGWEKRGQWDRKRSFAELYREIEKLEPDYLVIETDDVREVVRNFMEGSQKFGLRPIRVFDCSGLQDDEGNAFPPGEVWIYRFEDFWDGRAPRSPDASAPAGDHGG